MRCNRPRGTRHLHTPGEAGEDRLIVRHGIGRSVTIVDWLAVLGHETASWSVEAGEPETRDSRGLLGHGSLRLTDPQNLPLLQGEGAGCCWNPPLFCQPENLREYVWAGELGNGQQACLPEGFR